MFLHYIRIAFRNIFKTGLHSFINILGLSTGIACAVLVIFFVRDEVTFDQFHEKSGRIYRLYYNAERLDGSLVTNTVTPLVSARQLEENFSEIEKKASWMQNSFTVEHGEEAFEQQVNMTTPAFFDIFSFPMKAGSVNGIFQNPSDAVITESTAIKYFGKVDATGETLAIMMGDNRKLFEVVAVTEDPPSNSSIQFEILIWEEVMTEVFPRELFESWNLVMAENYLLLSEGVSPDDLEAKLPAFVESQIGEQQEGRLYELKLQPIEDIHLNSDMPAGIAPVSDPKFTSILTAIALLVLLMAGINFVNLSLGRSFGRAREIGIKKVVGAQRSVPCSGFVLKAAHREGKLS